MNLVVIINAQVTVMMLSKMNLVVIINAQFTVIQNEKKVTTVLQIWDFH